MSECHLEWCIIMTGPDLVAERSVLNDGDLEKLLKPGKALILQNEVVAFLQKPALLQQEMTEWVDCPEVVCYDII